eukprot:s78_g10.t1
MPSSGDPFFEALVVGFLAMKRLFSRGHQSAWSCDSTGLMDANFASCTENMEGRQHVYCCADLQAFGIDCDGMINSASAQSDASQWQQDWFVYKNFFQGSSLDVAGGAPGDRQGVFVDVGAFHPIHLSNTYFFERCLGWRGLCVEPNPSMHKYFEAYRPSCELVKNCVWSHPRRAYIREDETHDGSQMDSTPGSSGSSGAVKITGGGSRPEFVAEPLDHQHPKSATLIPEECRTLKDILASQGLVRPKVVDFLSVDAEAAEVEIFRDFPFDEFDIQAKLDFALKFPARMAAWRQALAKDFWEPWLPDQGLDDARRTTLVTTHLADFGMALYETVPAQSELSDKRIRFVSPIFVVAMSRRPSDLYQNPIVSVCPDDLPKQPDWLEQQAWFLATLDAKFSQQADLIRDLLDTSLLGGGGGVSGSRLDLHGIHGSYAPRAENAEALPVLVAADGEEIAEEIEEGLLKKLGDEFRRTGRYAAIISPEEMEIEEPEQPGKASFTSLGLRALRATRRTSMESTASTKTTRKSDTIRKATQVLGAKVMNEKLADEPPLRQFVKKRLDTFMAVVVSANICVMVLMTQWNGRNSDVALGLEEEVWPFFSQKFFDGLEYVFYSLYLIDVLLRSYVLRREWCYDPVEGVQFMNLFDATLVVISTGELILLPAIFSGGTSAQANAVRLLKLVRIVRTLRIIKAVSVFRQLRVLVATCLASIGALIWSMVLLMLLKLAVSLMAGQALQTFIQDESEDLEARYEMNNLYGSFTRAFYTFFEITHSGPWPSRVKPVLEKVSPWYSVLFLPYIALVVFAVIRVVTALFIKETLASAANDAEMVIEESRRMAVEYQERLEELFRLVDNDGDGSLSAEEFVQAMELPSVQQYLKFLDAGRCSCSRGSLRNLLKRLWEVNPKQCLANTAWQILADQQDITERQLCRHLKRLQEAQQVVYRGRQPSPQLIRNLRRHAHHAPEGAERQAISRQQRGAGLRMARDRFNALLKTKHDEAMSQWRKRISDMSGACQWVKRVEPTPWIIRDDQGEIVSNRAHAVQKLKCHWITIFGQQPLDTEPFWQLSAADLPPKRHAPRLQPINCAQIGKIAMKLKHKAAGPDGMLLCFYNSLNYTYSCRPNVEHVRKKSNMATGPSTFLHWKVTFIRKKTVR